MASFDENFINFYRFLNLFKTNCGKSVWKWTIPGPDLPETVFKDHMKKSGLWIFKENLQTDFLYGL